MGIAGRGVAWHQYAHHFHALIPTFFFLATGWLIPSCRPGTRRTSSSSRPARTVTRSSAATSSEGAAAASDATTPTRIHASSTLSLSEATSIGGEGRKEGKAECEMACQCPGGRPERRSLPEREERERMENAPGTRNAETKKRRRKRRRKMKETFSLHRSNGRTSLTILTATLIRPISKPPPPSRRSLMLGDARGGQAVAPSSEHPGPKGRLLLTCP